MIVETAELTRTGNHQRIHRTVSPRVDIFSLKNLLFRKLDLASMAHIMEHQRAFFHAAIDGSVHIGSNLTSRGADLLIGVEIDLVNHSSLASYILQLGHQGLRTIHKATFIIRKESDGIAPRLHGGLVFHNITFDLVDHLGGLFHSLHGETAHTDISQRAVDITL